MKLAPEALAQHEPSPTFAWLTPDAALDRGKAIHACDIAHTHGHHVNRELRLAQIVADEFSHLRGTCPHDHQFLQEVRSTVHSFASGLGRRKKQHDADLDEAEQEYAARQQAIHATKEEKLWLELVPRAAGLTAFGIIGALTAQILAPLVPPAIAHQTGHFIPTALAGLLSTVVVGYASEAWFRYERTAADARYRYRRMMADRVYAEGNLVEHDHHRAKLVRAWEAYTALRCPAEPAYGLIIREDLRVQARYARGLRRNHRSLWRQLGLRLLSRMHKKKR